MPPIKKINVYIAGGAGDAILSSRFIPAIRERHGLDCEVTAYFASDGATSQRDMVEAIYPGLFDKIVILGKESRISEGFCIKNYAFDVEENFPYAIANLKEEYLLALNDCDFLYNLHIDEMVWAEDPEFRARLSFLPKAYPEKIDSGEPNVIIHPYSRPNGKHNLRDFYLKRLVGYLTSKDIKVKIIISDENKSLIGDDITENIKVQIINSPIDEVCKIIGDRSCKLFIGIDSSLRLVANAYRTPTLVFSADCMAPFLISPSHYLRWLPFDKSVLPLNFDLSYTFDAIDAILKNPAAALFPIKEFEKYANIKSQPSL